MDFTDNYLIDKFNIDKRLIELSKKVINQLKDIFSEIDDIAEYNQLKVLNAMQKNNLSDIHFNYSNGYGYNDVGRDTLESIYANVFNTEDALVRPQIISGTHALTLALFGNLRHGDELLSPTGSPYDTLQAVIGVNPTKGSLIDSGIIYKQVDLLEDGKFDYENIKRNISNKTKFVTIQRSKGYTLRKPMLIEEIKELISYIKNIDENIICMVDNCYGEFVDIMEPSDVGADLVVGSLIKNPGGGLAPVGGYICGKKEYVENAAIKLSSPGIGKEAGPSLGITSQFLQGLFLAPEVVSSSMKNAVYTAKMFNLLGYKSYPEYNEKRSDIVQAVVMESAENLISFCKGIQMAAPVDSYVAPVPGDMPGYECDIIMAAGAFVQGSSIELSADGPLREPYTAFFQGGLTHSHGKNGVLIAINNMVKDGLINI